MDVYIDSQAITEGVETIAGSISAIEIYIQFLRSKIAAANTHFTTVNFKRADENVKLASRALDEMMENLNAAKEFLMKLVEHIEEYDRQKF